MPPKEETPKQESKAQQVIRAQDYKALYFNHAQVGHTQFDIFAILSEASLDAFKVCPIVEQRARITMAPTEALLLANFLVEAVRQWETATKQKVHLPPVEIEAMKKRTPEAEPVQ